MDFRPKPNEPSDQGHFATTQWSLVLKAGKQEDSAAEDALAKLCQRYWLPLYAYARRRSGDMHQAQDLTQEFFARLLEKSLLADAAPERGRFRSFLLTAMKNFIVNEWVKAGAEKRGGGLRRLSFDYATAESRLQLEPVDHFTPEMLFEREWALQLLDVVVQRLETEYRRGGKEHVFAVLKDYLIRPTEEASYRTAAEQLHVSEETARQAAHRLRKRYRELLRAEVAQTVASGEEVEDEIRRLFAALG